MSEPTDEDLAVSQSLLRNLERDDYKDAIRKQAQTFRREAKKKERAKDL